MAISKDEILLTPQEEDEAVAAIEKQIDAKLKRQYKRGGHVDVDLSEMADWAKVKVDRRLAEKVARRYTNWTVTYIVDQRDGDHLRFE